MDWIDSFAGLVAAALDRAKGKARARQQHQQQHLQQTQKQQHHQQQHQQQTQTQKQQQQQQHQPQQQPQQRQTISGETATSASVPKTGGTVVRFAGEISVASPSSGQKESLHLHCFEKVVLVGMVRKG